MLRSRYLTDEEKGFMRGLSAAGKTVSEIAVVTNRSKSTVSRLLRNVSHAATSKRTGRPSKLSLRDIRRVKLKLRRARYSTCKNLIRGTAVNASRWTVARVLRKYGLRWRKMKAIPRWQPHHLARRLEFARVHQTWDAEWRRVLFSDGLHYHWHGLHNEPVTSFSKRQGGPSVMVWGCIAYGGKLQLQRINGRLNAHGYQRVLDCAQLNDNGPILGGNDFVFQQDNAPIHTAASTKNWLQEHNIPTMEWPSLSPDLNPIENLWAMIVRIVYREGRQFDTVRDLETAIQDAWNEIDDSTLADLINSMASRMFKLILARG